MKQALHFLSDLKANNNRDWYHRNKDTYQHGKNQFEEFINNLIKALAEFEPGFEELEARDCMFRIFRDVRFSKNKDPYKTNFGAYMAVGGRKSPRAGYYIHMEPGNSFMGGGVWRPESNVLKKVREEIDYCSDEWHEIRRKIKPVWGGIQGDKLSRPPKGYSANHPDIEYLKHKDFLVSIKVRDQDFSKEVSWFSEKFRSMEPLVSFLNRAMEEA